MKKATLFTLGILILAIIVSACSSGGGGGKDDELGFGGDFLTNDLLLNLFNGATSFALAPHIISLSGETFIIWREDRDGGGDKIFYSQSNGNDTNNFLAEIRLDSAGAAEDIAAMAMAGEGNNIYVVYFNVTDSNLYLIASNDRGDTFLPEIQINVQAITNALIDGSIQVCADNGNLYILWKDDADPGLSFRASNDSGASFATVDDVRVDGTAGANISSEASLICNGNNVFAVWRDTRNGDGGDIFFTRSTDAGSTFEAETRLDSALAGVTCTSPTLCVDGNELWFGWEDARNGGTDIFMNYTSNAGVSFSGDRQVNVTLGASNPVVACADDYGMFAFTSAGNLVQFNRVKGGTGTFLAADTTVETVGGSAHGTVRMEAHSKTVFLAWTEADGSVDFNYSTNRGGNFPTQDQRISDAGAAAELTSIQMTTTAGKVRVVWEDDRSAPNDSDVFYQFGN